MFQDANVRVFRSGLASTLIVCFFLVSAANADLVTPDYQMEQDFLPNGVVVTTTNNVVASSELPTEADTNPFMALSTSTQIAADSNQPDELANRVSMLIDSDDNGVDQFLEFSSEFKLGEADVMLADMDSNVSDQRLNTITTSVPRSIELEQTFVSVTQSADAPAWFTRGSVHPVKPEFDREEFDSTSDVSTDGMASPSTTEADLNENQRIASVKQPLVETPVAISDQEAEPSSSDLASITTAIPEPSALSVMILLTPALLVRYRRVA